MLCTLGGARHGLRRWLLLATLALAPGLTAEPLETFHHQLSLSLVELDVRVTDDAGKPVTGLPQEAFTVFFDEQPMALQHFASTDATPSVTEAVNETPLAIIVLVDNRRLLPAQRNRMVRSLRDLLATRMAAGDAVMVAVYDEALTCLTPFSTEIAVMDEALAQLLAMPSRAAAQAGEAQRLRQALRRNARQRLALQAEVEAHVARQRAEIQRSVAALHEQILAVAGLPGRKALLFLSDGLESNPGGAYYAALPPAIQLRLRTPEKEVDLEQVSPVAQYLVTAPVWPGPETTTRALSLAPAIAAANANRVALYPLVPEPLAAMAAGGQRLARRRDRLQGYETLAGATGGTVVLDRTRNFGERLRNALAPSYTLAFQTPTPPDGSRYAIRVEVTDPTLQVHHRQAFFAKSVTSRLAERTLSTLFLDRKPNPLGLQAAVEALAATDGRGQQVALQLRIPAHGLALQQGTAGLQGRLHLCLVLRDAQGARSEVEHVQLPVSMPHDATRPAFFTYRTALRLRPGPHTMALGLLDEAGRTASFLRLDIHG